MSDPLVTKQCPYCAEQIRPEAIKCRYCGSRLETGASGRTWRRSRRARRIAGVCAGLAEEFGLSVTLVRLAFILATVVGGSGILVYIALWVLMPLAEPEDGLALATAELDEELRRPPPPS